MWVSVQGGEVYVIGCAVIVVIIIVMTTERHISTMKKWFQYASNRGTRTTSVTNSTFLLANVATPINSSYPCNIHMPWHHVYSAHAHKVLHTCVSSLVSTVESCDFAPPPLCILALGKSAWGGGLYVESLQFHVTTITDRRMPRGYAISGLSLTT